MKKFLLMIICVLIIAPCALVFSACGTPTSHLIEVLASDARYGLVMGGGTVANGTSMTITAKVKSDDTTFLCWTLDNKVVSNTPEYTFVVSDDTDGKYVAIFDQGCEYFVLSEATIGDVYEELKIEELNFQVKVGTTLSALQTITNTTTNPYSSMQNYLIDNFYTGTLIHKRTDNPNPFYCDIIANVKDYVSGELTFSKRITLDINELIDNGSIEFKNEGSDNRLHIDGFGKVALKFERLTLKHVEDILKIERK